MLAILAGAAALTAACVPGQDQAVSHAKASSTSSAAPSSATSSSAPSSAQASSSSSSSVTPSASKPVVKPAAPPAQPGGGSVAPGAVPDAGQVGFLGDPASLQVIDGANKAPAGTGWNTGVLQVTGNDVVLDKVFVKGGVTFQGSGTLTIKNSIIEGNHSAQSVVLGMKGHLDIQDSTIRWKAGDGGPQADWGNGAIHGDSTVTLLRNDISGTPDGIQNGPGRSTIEQNYIHDLALIGTYPNNTHNDGIQSYGGPDLVIRYNRIDIEGPHGVAYDGTHQNAAVFVQPSGTSSTNLQVVGNYLAGGGYIMRLEGPMSGAVVTDNKFGPTTGGWGEVLVNKDVGIARWSGNVSAAGKTVAQP
jgi:hypothetical protein